MNPQGGAGQKSTNATLWDSKKGEWVGMGADFMFWYDASEIKCWSSVSTYRVHI